MSSPGSTEALTPNHFLKLKTKVVLSPPGVFKSADLYARKWWRQVQHLTNEFCCRWKREFSSLSTGKTKVDPHKEKPSSE